MGDRCQVEVTVRKDQVEQFIKIVGYDPDGELENDLSVTLAFHETNYGMGMVLDVAACALIEFYGEHTAGDSYGAADFFSDGKGNIHYIPTGDEGYGIIVSGATPSQRLERLHELEERISARNDHIERMRNPLYDLTRQSDVHTS